MTKRDFYALVDDYVRGKLDDQALIEFEDAMLEDPDLFAEVEMTEAMINLLHSKPVTRKSKWVPFLSVAAMLLLGMVAFQFFKPTEVSGSTVIRPILGEAISDHLVDFGAASTFVLNVETTLETQLSWTIENIAGEEIKKGIDDSAVFSIRLKKKDFPRGIYTLQVFDENGDRHIKARLKLD